MRAAPCYLRRRLSAAEDGWSHHPSPAGLGAGASRGAQRPGTTRLCPRPCPHLPNPAGERSHHHNRGRASTACQGNLSSQAALEGRVRGWGGEWKNTS